MNNEISILRDKIARVEEDIAKTTNESGSEKKRITLMDYLDYLKDELRMLETDPRFNGND
jgi:hypothetical protein